MALSQTGKNYPQQKFSVFKVKENQSIEIKLLVFWHLKILLTCVTYNVGVKQFF